ncbi:helix-turn-helix domain-containing protein [Mycolicibacterium sp.]|uniref:AraC family transcriptional regulator n=1 Tax=Mycolicibacterium sp. TaxID=2320850 RepID=UPI003D1450D4
MTAAAAATLPRTCCPSVWLWPGEALYAGPGLDLDPHSGSVWCLAVGVDGPLRISVGTRRVTARSVLIPPRVIHHLDTRGGRLVSCYLDPTSSRASAARARFRNAGTDLATGHRDEELLAEPPADADTARRWLGLAAPVPPRQCDSRIAAIAARIGADPAAAPSSSELAAAVGLSESRLLHLFRRETGTSLRRYRLWIRLMRAGAAIGAGHNLTRAAADAGFASPSHLADRFKATFGLTATQLLKAGVVLHTPAQTATS